MLRTILTLPLLVFLLLTVGCRQVELQSEWRQDSLLIDGLADDWRSAASYHLEEPPLGIALCNDQEFLYLRLTTHDEDLKSQIAQGNLTIWLDPQGEKEKRIGIALQSKHRQPPGSEMKENFNSQSPRKVDADDEQPGKNLFELSIDGKSIGTFSTTENRYSLSLAFGTQHGGAVFELKMPVSVKNLYSLTQGNLAIGLASGQSQPSKQQAQMRPQGGQGAPAGRGMRGGTQRQGGRPGDKQQTALEFWFTAQLAEQPQAG